LHKHYHISLFFTAVNRYPTIELGFIGNNGGRKSSPQTKSQSNALKNKTLWQAKEKFCLWNRIW